MADQPSRDELRRRLRAKRGEKRNGENSTSFAQQARRDPTTALLAMGVDDMDLLKHANQIVKNPAAFLAASTSSTRPSADVADDEEEAPPPL